MKKITIATLELPYATKGNELRQLRDEFVSLIGSEHNIAHGHNDDGTYEHKYALIQYRRDFIIGIGKGAELLLSSWMQHRDSLSDAHLNLSTVDVQLTEEANHYYMHRWLPLSNQNYLRWKDMNELERKQELERILVAEMLTFMRGIDWYVQDKVIANITKIVNQKKVNVMNRKTADWEETNFISFGIYFDTNVQLPLHIGLGRCVRLGYGVLEPVFQSNKANRFREPADQSIAF